MGSKREVRIWHLNILIAWQDSSHRALYLRGDTSMLSLHLADVPHLDFFKDPANAADELLRRLGAGTSRGSQTTGTHLESSRTADTVVIDGLTTDEGIALLRRIGIRGTDEELATICRQFNGNALSLNLLGRYLVATSDADIRHWRKLQSAASEAETTRQPATAVLASVEEWLRTSDRIALAILRLTGLFDRPASPGCLAALRAKPAIPVLTEDILGLKENEWGQALRRLSSLGLISIIGEHAGFASAIDSHPLIREYFASSLKSYAGSREAHRRLYEYLIHSTPETPRPTLVELQPLYESIVHGCQAGLQQDAFRIYRNRILKGDQYYSQRTLGAYDNDLGALSNSSSQPWKIVSPVFTDQQQAWILNQASTCLRALGRYAEAIDALTAEFELFESRNEWANAAVAAGNLSELELTIGLVAQGLDRTRIAVRTAALSKDDRLRHTSRMIQAYAMHLAGQFAEAGNVFNDVMSDTHIPSVNAVADYRYNDYLLTLAERAAWRCADADPPQFDKDLRDCRDVRLRVEMRQTNYRKHNLFDTALYELMVAKCELLELILLKSLRATLRSAIALPLTPGKPSRCNRAVESLRRTGQIEYLLLGLLTRAWSYAVTGTESDLAKSREDLDESMNTTLRHTMPLVQADIHLYRARLFGNRDIYPWRSPRHDLQDARRLIEKHGYWRRKDELEDAEQIESKSASAIRRQIGWKPDEFRRVSGQPIESLGEDMLLTTACEIIQDGMQNALSKYSHLVVGQHWVVGAPEIESVNALHSLIQTYSSPANRTTGPLSIADFGLPGSGKSWIMQQIVRSSSEIAPRFFTINLSQCKSVEDVLPFLRSSRVEIDETQFAVYFFDEFDGPLDKQQFGWLKYFLAPMENGNLPRGNQSFQFGQSLFVFVGGNHWSFTDFEKSASSKAGRSVKAPDFISRLHGHIDIPDLLVGDESDSLAMIHRAIAPSGNSFNRD